MSKPLTSFYSDPKTGEKIKLEYINADSFDGINLEKVQQVYGVCFYQENIIVVKTGDTWILPGGAREPGESIEQALKREIREETNMETLTWQPIGIQTVFPKNDQPYYQIRAACKVRPYGSFISDPDGDVSEIKLINPQDYRQYFDWGDIGEEIMKRAEFLNTLLK